MIFQFLSLDIFYVNIKNWRQIQQMLKNQSNPISLSLLFIFMYLHYKIWSELRKQIIKVIIVIF